MSEKENDFEELISELPDIIEEKDLEKLLDAKLDLFSNIYSWLLGTFVTLAVVLVAYRFTDIANPKLLVTALVLIIGGYFLFCIFVLSINPRRQQKEYLKQYINAKKRLRSMREETRE